MFSPLFSKISENLKMSLKWLHQKMLKSKDFSEFKQKKFDYKNDDAVPRRLRDSMHSVEARGISATSSNQAVNGDETPEIFSEDEDDEAFENARTCPEDCEHDDCPFQPRLSSSSEIFMAIDSRYTASSVSLVRKVSSMSFLEANSSFDCDQFLRISRVVPLRNNSVIVHWNVKSYLGIRGYKIYIDGTLNSTVFSSERTSAFITSIDMSRCHRFSISIIPDTLALFPNKFSLLEPAFYFYTPL